VAILHTVNKSPYERNNLESCLTYSKAGSGIILIEDGVYGAISQSGKSELLKAAVSDKKVYVLGPDLKARGLSEDLMIEGVEIVDYDRFVVLVTEFDKVQAWL